MENMHEARKQLSEFLDKINTYVMRPVGNQPDKFLLGTMQASKGKYFEPKGILELTENMVIPSDYFPEKEHEKTQT